MDITAFFEKNFEEEEIDETQKQEINNLFDDFLGEMEKPKKEFSLREFIDNMDPSEDESDDELEEREEPPIIEPAQLMEPNHVMEPAPMEDTDEENEDESENENGENFEDEENIDPDEERDQGEDENGENLEDEENIDPVRADYDSRVRSFPAGVRQETTNCTECELPYSKKSMKRHLMDKHDIDAECVDDYCETYTNIPTFKKLQMNKKTGKPEVKVRFTGKKNKIKNDVFPTSQLWALKSFRRYIRDLTENGSKREKKIVMSEQIKKEKKTRKVAVKRFGKFAQDNRYECSICRKRKRAFNASVMCHNNDDNVVPHAFCTPCLTKWTKKNNNSCPLCRAPGVPIKIYHN